MLRTLSRLLVSAFVTPALLAASFGAAHAQGARGVGLFAGVDRGRQLISRQDPSDARTGFLAGAFVDVATPGGFDVLAEAYVVQRGGKVTLGDLRADVEVDYLTFALYAKGRLALGPASLYAYAGPHVDTHLRTRAAGELITAYRESAGQAFGVTAGAGLEFGVGGGRAAYLEARVDEGLTDAFPDPAEQIRHRTLSLVLRLAWN